MLAAHAATAEDLKMGPWASDLDHGVMEEVDLVW